MLLNTLASEEQLILTPSSKDGVPLELEYDLKARGCRLIQQVGILVKLPQRTMAVAQILFQRFWYVSSLKNFSVKDICMGALFLATKLEETPTRLRHLINSFDYVLRRQDHTLRRLAQHCPHDDAFLPSNEVPIDSEEVDSIATKFRFRPAAYYDQSFYDMKEAIVVAEMQMLKRLSFKVHVVLPYAILANYLQVLGLSDEQITLSTLSVDNKARGIRPKEGRPAKSFAQRAWSVLNDGLQTPIYCLFPPQIIACAAIYLTAGMTMPALELPENPRPWWMLFDATKAEIEVTCAHLLRLYSSRHSNDGIVDGLLEKRALREYLKQ